VERLILKMRMLRGEDEGIGDESGLEEEII
jgi:hypothetical protein